MADTTSRRMQAREATVPEARTPADNDGVKPAVPCVTVLGIMEANVLVRCTWLDHAISISHSRLKFIADELKMDVRDDPDNYVL